MALKGKKFSQLKSLLNFEQYPYRVLDVAFDQRQQERELLCKKDVSSH